MGFLAGSMLSKILLLCIDLLNLVRYVLLIIMHFNIFIHVLLLGKKMKSGALRLVKEVCVKIGFVLFYFIYVFIC